MALTSPDNLFSPDAGAPYALTEDLAALADSVQDALTARLGTPGTHAIYSYRWADSTARGAQTGMRAGDYGYQVDTGLLYRYDGAAWVLDVSNPEYVEYRLNAGQTLTSGTVATLDFDASPSVSRGTWSESAGVVTVPRSGYYQICVAMKFAANATGVRYFQVFKNGLVNDIMTQSVSASIGDTLIQDRRVYLAAGDTVRLRAFQNSGGSLSVGEFGATKEPIFSIYYVGPR